MEQNLLKTSASWAAAENNMKLAELNAHRLTVRKTARFFTLGDINADLDDVWIALHGYGQTATDFAQPFRSHHSKTRLFVFPEGLSRFYQRDKNRTIGASWMTSEDRKAEIRDYIEYLNRVYDVLMERGLSPDISTTVLGFSQGTATASRWLHAGTVRARRLILWGGAPAAELLNKEFLSRIPGVRVTLIAGDSDPFIRPEKLKEIASQIALEDRPIETLTYEGAHEIHPAMLASLLAQPVDQTHPF